MSLKVAATVATGIVDAGQVTETIAFAGLIGAIAWNLITWGYGLPSSSSHALIGGVIGAMLAAVGVSGVQGTALLTKVVLPALVAPVAAFVLAGLAIVVIYRLRRRQRPGAVTRGFRVGPDRSRASALSLAHGTNDAQKTMGVISAGARRPRRPQRPPLPRARLGGGRRPPRRSRSGTYAGGWRIIRTVGTRIIKMDSAQGFSAQGAGAAVILVSSHFGYPLSSTHVISGGVIGAGAAKRLSAVRWGVAGNIAVAWVMTLPAAGAVRRRRLRAGHRVRQRAARPAALLAATGARRR